MSRNWAPIINQARTIVNGYQYLITLRQLHYRLVMTQGLGYINNQTDYKQLSALTAEGRRQGNFPALQDQTRTIHRLAHWDSPAEGIRALASQYRRNRTETQDCFLCLAGEKATLLAQMNDWFNRDITNAANPADNRRALGIPIVLTRGYGSQTYTDDVKDMVLSDGRKAVLIYAGDMDPSGEDILRDFLHRTDCFDEVEHIAVRDQQISGFGLAVNEGKPQDSRAEAFVDRYPELHGQYGLGWGKMQRVKQNDGYVMRPTPVQIEVEAIEPNDLRQLYQDALDRWWNQGAYDTLLDVEGEERQQLYDLIDQLEQEESE
jgi:hypothetical protein